MVEQLDEMEAGIDWLWFLDSDMEYVDYSSSVPPNANFTDILGM